MLRSNLGHDLLSFAWSLSFVLANLVMFIFFSRTTTMSWIEFPIIAFVSFLIIGEIPRWKGSLALIFIISITIYNMLLGSIAAVGLFCIYYMLLLKKYQDDSKDYIIKNWKDTLKIIRLNITKAFVTGIRLLFFNIAYMLFPLLFIWLLAFGGVYMLSQVKLSMNLTISSFGTILTVLGVVFGLLQYYFNRHEDKVQQKYNMNFSLIVFPIKKFSFDEFVKFLGEQEKYKKLFNSAKQLTYIDITDLENINKIFKMRQGGSTNLSITVNMPEVDDITKFQIFELKYVRSPKPKEVYKAFFEAKENEIKEELKSKLRELNTLVWFLFSNINIVEESNAMFMNLDLNKNESEPETYLDFIRLAQLTVFEYAINLVFNGYTGKNENTERRRE